MKFNLKNRPSHDWMINNLDKIENVEAWFKAFEKELKERLASAEFLMLTCREASYGGATAISIVEEILGK